MIHRNHCSMVGLLTGILFSLHLVTVILVLGYVEVPCSSDLGYCNIPGDDYPWKEMKYFIEENQSLLKRMYGNDINYHQKSYPPPNIPFEPRLLDDLKENACPSDILTILPYWANNSEGNTYAIVNFHPFEQGLQNEICKKNSVGHCKQGCHCEQNYAWYRLLAMDPKNKCKGIFMDWFQFPSCCACRCYDYYGNDVENNARQQQQNFIFHREARFRS